MGQKRKHLSILINIYKQNKTKQTSPEVTVPLLCCSVTKSCPILCNPMDCSSMEVPLEEGFPVPYYLQSLPKFIWKIPWRRKWQPTPVFLPRKFHGLRSLVGYSPWGCTGSDMTAWLSTCSLDQWCYPTCHPLMSSHPLLPSSAFSLSQHQGLFQWVGCSYQMAKVLELQLQH